MENPRVVEALSLVANSEKPELLLEGIAKDIVHKVSLTQADKSSADDFDYYLFCSKTTWEKILMHCLSTLYYYDAYDIYHDSDAVTFNTSYCKLIPKPQQIWDDTLLVVVAVSKSAQDT